MGFILFPSLSRVGRRLEERLVEELETAAAEAAGGVPGRDLPCSGHQTHLARGDGEGVGATR